ncbi:MAG: DUF4097 family beta strand repeat-containing protein [Jatrophihabitantaceae bacterium]
MTAKTTTREKSFPLTGPINLIVRYGHGSVTVSARDDLAEALVRLTARIPDSDILDRIAIEMRGPTLAVVAPRQGGLSDLFGGFRDRDTVDAEITVPSGTAMKLTTGSADITVTGRSGGADVASGSAHIDLDAVDGDLRVRCGSASSRVRAVSGDVVARSGSGDLSLGEIAGAVQAGSGSGNLSIDTAHGPVRSRAGSGDMRIGTAHGDVDVTAGSGGLSVGVPAGVSARLDVRTGSGRVRTDLPIDDSPANGTEITVRARTGSGDVRLFRAGHDAAA